MLTDLIVTIPKLVPHNLEPLTRKMKKTNIWIDSVITE